MSEATAPPPDYFELKAMHCESMDPRFKAYFRVAAEVGIQLDEFS